MRAQDLALCTRHANENKVVLRSSEELRFDMRRSAGEKNVNISSGPYVLVRGQGFV